MLTSSMTTDRSSLEPRYEAALVSFFNRHNTPPRLAVLLTGTPLVDPNDDIATMTAVVLGWKGDDDLHPLGTLHIESISEEKIYLRSHL